LIEIKKTVHWPLFNANFVGVHTSIQRESARIDSHCTLHAVHFCYCFVAVLRRKQQLTVLLVSVHCLMFLFLFAELLLSSANNRCVSLLLLSLLLFICCCCCCCCIVCFIAANCCQGGSGNICGRGASLMTKGGDCFRVTRN